MKGNDNLNRVYIIAEAGVNHNGSLEMAHALIDRAAEAGADAVKFQTFRAGEVVSRHVPRAPYQQGVATTDESQLEMLQKLQLDEPKHQELLRHCQSRDIDFISSPFDLESLDLLANRLRLSRIKIASGEITNAPLLLKAARTGKSILLSTGMSSLGEVETALSVLAFGLCEQSSKPSLAACRTSYSSPEGQKALREKVTLLHCTSAYPAPFGEVNLLAMDTLGQAFGLPVGYSDHTPGIAVAIAAAARGAAVIEKHFTLDRNLPGPDHRASLEPAELQAMITSIRQVELALGSPRKYTTGAELINRSLVRKSLVATRPIRQGELFTEENLGVKRPGHGVEPTRYWDYLGRPADRSYQADEEIE